MYESLMNIHISLSALKTSDISQKNRPQILQQLLSQLCYVERDLYMGKMDLQSLQRSYCILGNFKGAVLKPQKWSEEELNYY